VTPYALEPARPAKTRPVWREREEEESGNGAWVPSGLFVLVLLAGLALALYVLVRPILPAGWF
jgi:hypothetical protein